jgi:hypothetical protein
MSTAYFVGSYQLENLQNKKQKKRKQRIDNAINRH